MSDELQMRSCEAAEDARRAVREFDNACQWLDRAREGSMSPLAAEAWVFDEDLAQVLLEVKASPRTSATTTRASP